MSEDDTRVVEQVGRFVTAEWARDDTDEFELMIFCRDSFGSAEMLVIENLGAISSVADALIAQGTLTARQVAMIVNSAPSRGRPHS